MDKIEIIQMTSEELNNIMMQAFNTAYKKGLIDGQNNTITCDKKTYGVKEAARMLDCSEATIRKFVKNGVFGPAENCKIGGCVRIPAAKIEGYLQS